MWTDDNMDGIAGIATTVGLIQVCLILNISLCNQNYPLGGCNSDILLSSIDNT